jgi:hypothetical protein
MKSNLELEACEIVDRLSDLANLAAALAVGIHGLQQIESEDASNGLVELAWQLQESIKTVSEEIRAAMPKSAPVAAALLTFPGQ